jgi:hypothetical protein
MNHHLRTSVWVIVEKLLLIVSLRSSPSTGIGVRCTHLEERTSLCRYWAPAFSDAGFLTLHILTIRSVSRGGLSEKFAFLRENNLKIDTIKGLYNANRFSS